ncbi:RES family NAD+ phosphorylase [Sphingobium sp. BYY-5]|uniref:RES family NAD+ phosphorylase n=1 Tax=Sphingobium sp. BYY-5 TaxID=2926400 RepID=UPI001FA6AF40|nr:RES family NAD+ phosphorylase [Sphingobium sp. BYY-5]MCI4592603.1 RES family NAD+ phosphorylase [Sphingobium sp. BYY-5]
MAGAAPMIIPSPPANLATLVTRMTWPKGDIIHRIHPDIYQAGQFNPGPKGNARFSPILDATTNSIATIYGGTGFACAAMETVFHDVPFAPGLKTVAKRKLKAHHYSQLAPSFDLVLADLNTKALRKLGIKRGELIDTEKNIYPQTRKWAEAFHAQCPDIQGLCWVSRQDDTARAIILFEDRLGPKPLSAATTSLDLVTDAATHAALVSLADDIGVKITGR